MSRIAYVNGQFLPLEEARISVLDRGFLFADGAYEVTCVIDGGLVDFNAHIARLQRSLGEIGMPMPSSGVWKMMKVAVLPFSSWPRS